MKKPTKKEIRKLSMPLAVVPWGYIKMEWGKREFKRFKKWMAGQTCVEDGVYLCDVENYMNQRNKGIKDPECWD